MKRMLVKLKNDKFLKVIYQTVTWLSFKGCRQEDSHESKKRRKRTITLDKNFGHSNRLVKNDAWNESVLFPDWNHGLNANFWRDAKCTPNFFGLSLRILLHNKVENFYSTDLLVANLIEPLIYGNHLLFPLRMHLSHTAEITDNLKSLLEVLDKKTNFINIHVTKNILILWSALPFLGCLTACPGWAPSPWISISRFEYMTQNRHNYLK